MKCYILCNYISPEKINKMAGTSAEFIAFSQSAILSFELAGMSYKTINDFCPLPVFRKEFPGVINDVEELFKRLDKLVEKEVDFPRAYTGNIYSFINSFIDIHYITKVVREIKNEYSDVTLILDKKYDTLMNIVDDICNKEEVNLFEDFFVSDSIDKKIGILISCFPQTLIIEDDFENKIFNVNGNLTPVKQGMCLGIKNFIKIIISVFTGRERNIFVCYGGYDFTDVKGKLLLYNYIYPHEIYVHKKCGKVMVDIDFNNVQDAIYNFIEQNYPELKTEIFKLFMVYNEIVVLNISVMKNFSERLFAKYKPKVLVYGNYAPNIFDNILCYTANSEDITIICLQHGGPCIYAKLEVYLNQYREYNKDIRHIQLLWSQREKEVYAKKNKNYVVTGSPRAYSLTNSSIRPIKKIIYFPYGFSEEIYRLYMANIDDYDVFLVMKNILSMANKLDVEMDIKVSPVSERVNYRYFNVLNKNFGSNKIKILSGFSAEKIMNSYGLMIFNNIGGTLFGEAIGISVPIIVYANKDKVINKPVRSDLEERCYFVETEDDLLEKVELFKKDKLDSKWSEDMVDKYTYPVGSQPPADLITKYIKKTMSDRRNTVQAN